MAVEVRKLLNVLGQAQIQAPCLNAVEELVAPPTHLTMVLLRRPPYQAALEAYLEFQRNSGVHLSEATLEAPLENLPYLYQVWGTLEIITMLLTVAHQLGYILRSERLVAKDPEGIGVKVLRDGSPAVVLEHPVRKTLVFLIPQRTYPTDGKLRSVTYEQRPDVTVEVRPSRGDVRGYLFDPKYRLDGESAEDDGGDRRPKKTDIDKMHTYRDAIRDERNMRVVRYAAILYPGPGITYSQEVESLSAYPGKETDLASNLNAHFSEWLGV